jgi:hypothetical protein
MADVSACKSTLLRLAFESHVSWHRSNGNARETEIDRFSEINTRRPIMKRQFTAIALTATLSALFGGALLNAQDRSEVATIPFSFHAQGKLLPAGNYSVTEQNYSGDIYQLRSSTGQSIYWLAPTENTADPANPKLTFVKAGSEYVLSSVAMPGDRVSHGISDATVQKNLSRSMGIASLVAIPLHAR